MKTSFNTFYRSRNIMGAYKKLVMWTVWIHQITGRLIRLWDVSNYFSINFSDVSTAWGILFAVLYGGTENSPPPKYICYSLLHGLKLCVTLPSVRL
jgi:hypothetical protein